MKRDPEKKTLNGDFTLSVTPFIKGLIAGF